MRSSRAASSALIPGPSKVSLHSAVNNLRCSGALSLQAACLLITLRRAAAYWSIDWQN